MPDLFANGYTFDQSVAISDQARASVARRVLAHPSGDTDILNYLGLETFA